MSNTQIAAAAETVRRAATRRRQLTLTDEFGPFRGRPMFGGADAKTIAAARATLGLDRSALAYEVA